MKNKLIIILSLLVILAAVAVGIVTKNSYYDDMSQWEYIDNENIKVVLAPILNDVYTDYTISNAKNLEETVDVIVRVSVKRDAERKRVDSNTVSTVDVVEVYKGEVETDTISVFEPIYYFPEGDYVMSTEGYYWMRADNEYILFLRQLEDVNFGQHKLIYLPTTARYSKYNVAAADDLKETGMYMKLRREIFSSLGLTNPI